LKIILAKQAGFCFGVKRATQMAFETANKGGKTFTLGPIIHSPQVVQRLEEMGVGVLNSVSELDNGAIIIRSHGVASEELKEAIRKNLEIVDATCPFVKKALSMLRVFPEQVMTWWWLGTKIIPRFRALFPMPEAKYMWSVLERKRQNWGKWAKSALLSDNSVF
jgi:(E)-4-hydroxy-3-methyl-but-2-enyl pyrophosphate reductase